MRSKPLDSREAHHVVPIRFDGKDGAIVLLHRKCHDRLPKSRGRRGKEPYCLHNKSALYRWANAIGRVFFYENIPINVWHLLISMIKIVDGGFIYHVSMTDICAQLCM